VQHLLHSTGRCHLRLQAFRQLQASLTDLGLTICRAVTDLTPGFALPPVLDYPL